MILDPESTVFGPAYVRAAASGLNVDHVDFSYSYDGGKWVPHSSPSGLTVTAAPGDDVVFSLASATLSGMEPYPGGGLIFEETCVPAEGVDPTLGRVPVHNTASSPPPPTASASAH